MKPTQTKVPTCLLLYGTELGVDGKQYRQVKCWCGQVLALNGLGSHLHFKHKQKKTEVLIE